MPEDSRYDPLRVIFNEIDGAIQTVGKKEVIRDHLHSAFFLISDARSPSSVHVLSMAAHEMLRSIAHKSGIALSYEIKGLRKIETAEERQLSNSLYNFFKHARNDHAEVTEFKARNLAIYNELILASACVNFRSIFELTDDFIERYLAYHWMRFRSTLDNEANILIQQLEEEKAITEEERLYLLRSGLSRITSPGLRPWPR